MQEKYNSHCSKENINGWIEEDILEFGEHEYLEIDCHKREEDRREEWKGV